MLIIIFKTDSTMNKNAIKTFLPKGHRFSVRPSSNDLGYSRNRFRDRKLGRVPASRPEAGRQHLLARAKSGTRIEPDPRSRSTGCCLLLLRPEKVGQGQCDQIGRFIGLWATF